MSSRRTSTAIATPRLRVAQVREPAPNFECEAVVCGSFEDLSLDYYLSRGQWLVLLFIPMAFSFVCPTEVISFNNVVDEFTEQGCAVAFVSTDSKHSLYQWQSKPRIEGGLGNIQIPLLSDQNHKMSRAYGVLLEDRGFALRAMFIINPEGIIKHVSINDLAVGRSVLEALRLLQAFKQEQEHGVFCAANWRPGLEAEQLLPTEEGKQEYLERHFGKLSISPGSSGRSSLSSGPSVSGTAPTSGAADSGLDGVELPESADTVPTYPSSPGAKMKKKHPVLASGTIPPVPYVPVVTSPTSHPRQETNISPGAKKFAEALHKVFGTTPQASPLPSPLPGVEHMDALNLKNEADRKRRSGLSVESYFDFEPVSSAD